MANVLEFPITGIVASGTSRQMVGGFTNNVLNTAATRAGVVFQAPEDATIIKLGLSLRSTVGTTSRKLRFVLGSVSTTGFFNAVLAATNDYEYNDAALTYDSTAGTITYLDITKDSSGNTISSYNITRGTYYCIVVERGSTPGTWDASNYITLNEGPSTAANQTDWFYNFAVPYAHASSTTKRMGGIGIALSSSKAYGKGAAQHDTQIISAGTTTSYGMRFKLPSTLADNVSINGITFGADVDGTTGTNLEMRLYEDLGTGNAQLLYSYGINENFQEINNTYIRWLFDASQSIKTNKDYIIALCNVNASGNLGMHHFVYQDSKELSLYTNNLIPIRGVEVSSSGVITETSKVYHLNILVDDFTMNGGINNSFGGGFNG
jgi:hypothetical protein